MEEILNTFWVDGDILKTVLGMLVLFVSLVMLLDAVYIIKSAMKSAF